MQFIKMALDNVGESLVEEIRSRLSKKDINNTGQASASLNYNSTDTKLEIRGERYIGALDKGRRPGKFPPVQVIRDWVAQKLGIGGAENNSIAYLIGRKIAREGTTIYQDNSRGIELESVKEIGIRKIKQNISDMILKDIKSKVMDLSKGATA